MPKIVKFAVAILFLGLCWVALFQDRSPAQAWALVSDRMDSRPARTILILGNSRTSANDMPDMLRHIADAAHDPQKYALTVIAPNGASFASLSKDEDVRQDVGQSWDDVIVQGESRGQSTPELASSFLADGQTLLKAAHPKTGKSRLLVNWAYDSSLYDKDDAGGRAEHYGMIQTAHLDLARRTDAHIVNVGRLWEDLHQKMPDLALTVDGNHPSPVGSYFVALCLYADLSGHDVGTVNWAPDGIAPDVASRVRAIVSQDRSEL
jgi:hypothetical protein